MNCPQVNMLLIADPTNQISDCQRLRTSNKKGCLIKIDNFDWLEVNYLAQINFFLFFESRTIQMFCNIYRVDQITLALENRMVFLHDHYTYDDNCHFGKL